MNTGSSIPKSPRIEIADALRGFALAAIVLLHNVEHYDFYYFPEGLPHFIKIVDKTLWDSVFFLFSGKAYALFALLFGFSFFIQFNNQEKKGLDFRGRFLWRLLLLLVLGIFNSIFYSGDILAFYAIIGISLIPVCKWGDRAVVITIVIFMLQPWELGRLIYILHNPDFIPGKNLSGYYFGLADHYMQGSSFWELAKGNLWNGRMADITWSWEQGRLFQTSAIFMMGMLVGRRGYFVSVNSKMKIWRKALIVSAILFILFYILKQSLPQLVLSKPLLGSLKLIISSWSNFALASTLVSLFVVLYQNKVMHSILHSLAPFGRMSLTNYMVQSILGSFIYYGYGLGLYKYTGASFNILIALSVIMIQITFSRWWLERYGQGPLERLWHKATWLKFNRITKQKEPEFAESNKF
jgi:uncharacterized protein